MNLELVVIGDNQTGEYVNNSWKFNYMSNIIGYFGKPDRNIKVNAPTLP